MGPFRDGWTREQVEAVIAADQPEDLLYVPIAISMDPPDDDWAEAICLRLSGHADPRVRGNAVLGLGHLARVLGTLDLDAALPVVRAALNDPDAWVRGQADCAAHDVGHFLGVAVRD